MPGGAAQDSNASISSGPFAGFPVFPTHLAYTLYLCRNQLVAHEQQKRGSIVHCIVVISPVSLSV